MRSVKHFFFYGLFGWLAEVVWTALYDAVTGTRRAAGDTHARVAATAGERWRLEGTTYLWMLPIYGGGGLVFERVHAAVALWPWYFRGAVYCVGAFAIEAASGWILKWVTGQIPWDYSYSRASALGGAIRLDYVPVWFAFGMMLERVQAFIATLN
jgi:Putative ABC-transporter type IV